MGSAGAGMKRAREDAEDPQLLPPALFHSLALSDGGSGYGGKRARVDAASLQERGVALAVAVQPVTSVAGAVLGALHCVGVAAMMEGGPALGVPTTTTPSPSPTPPPLAQPLPPRPPPCSGMDGLLRPGAATPLLGGGASRGVAGALPAVWFEAVVGLPGAAAAAGMSVGGVSDCATPRQPQHLPGVGWGGAGNGAAAAMDAAAAGGGESGGWSALPQRQRQRGGGRRAAVASTDDVDMLL